MIWTDPTVFRVLVGTVLIAITAALLGAFTFFQKKALIGDAISHAILPGIALAYITTGMRETWIMMIGALLVGLIANLSVTFIQGHPRIKPDAAIAIVLSSFFAFGLVLISYIQGINTSGNAGLTDFLFGKVAAISDQDVILFTVLSVLIVTLVILRINVLKGISFDPNFMRLKGTSIRKNEFLMNVLTILTIAMGIQAVGVVLMSALLIIPVVAARVYSNRLITILFLACIIGLIGAVSGSYFSLIAMNLPTGPLIILALCCELVLISLFKSMKINLNKSSNG